MVIVGFIASIFAALVIGGAISIGVLHYRSWSKTKSKMGLLPFHVWVISIAHVLSTCLALYGAVLGGIPTVVSIVLFFISAICTLLAFWIIGSFQYSRVHEPETLDTATITLVIRTSA